MTVYSSRYSIPMPEDGDPIYLGASQMRALGTKVDKVLGQVADASALDATSAATPGRIIQRDSNGRAKVAAPAASDDIATRGTVTAGDNSIKTTTLGGLTIRKSSTAPAAGTASTIITFVS